MKKILRFLQWTGLVLLSILITVSILTAARQNLKFDAPYPDIRSSRDTAVIAKGKHLVNAIAHCMDCHSQANSDSLSWVSNCPDSVWTIANPENSLLNCPDGVWTIGSAVDFPDTVWTFSR